MSASRCWKLSNPDSIYLRSHLKFILILEKQLDPSSEVIVRSISQSLNRILVKPRQPQVAPRRHHTTWLRKHLVAWIQQAHRDTWRFHPSLGQKQVLRQEKCLTYVWPVHTHTWFAHGSAAGRVIGRGPTVGKFLSNLIPNFQKSWDSCVHNVSFAKASKKEPSPWLISRGYSSIYQPYKASQVISNPIVHLH